MNVLRYSSAAQRGFHKVHREIRSVQAERRKREQSGQARPQAAEPEKVMAVGSVLYNDPEPEPAPEPEREVTTDNRQLTTEAIGFVPQEAKEPEPACKFHPKAAGQPLPIFFTELMKIGSVPRSPEELAPNLAPRVSDPRHQAELDMLYAIKLPWEQ